ncbi:MAG: polyprenyl synthetase family protein [Actinomycetota bacterium]|nr:polyprenyl synthetase family protein [Actinomycetota bacterium]
MAGSTRLVDLVQLRLDEFLDVHCGALAQISPDLGVLEDATRSLLAGGKRFRALFCYWGWRSVSGFATELDELHEGDGPGLDAVISVASSLEMFHAAALVHDDIMDNSDLRRGKPSVHKRFEAWHREQGWSGSAGQYGEASALLVGDLLLAWSDELFDAGTRALQHPDAATAARDEFAKMRTEVTVGQYLDMLEETSWRSRPETELLPRAHRVIIYKSAKYSVEAPLAIGASLADASLPQLAALRAFGLPLGVAFQLRDDLLGVFGDPAVTGKPAGDDLREGKRTVLVTLARQKLPGGSGRLFDELLGEDDLDDQQIRMLQNAVRDSGAVEQVEKIIAHNVGIATAALTDAPLTRSARDQLGALADAVTRRES